MPIETEICLALPAAAARRLPTLPLFKGLADRRQQLRAVYFDTPQGHLRESAAGLRIRRESGAWVQTFKMGLSPIDRIEISQPLLGRSATQRPLLSAEPFPDDLMLRDPKSGKSVVPLVNLLPSLLPVFETHVRRRSWQLVFQGSLIEVALDQGDILVPGGEQRPICEVELELCEGQQAALWLLAQQLLEGLGEGVCLEPRSKAARGYRLAGFPLGDELELLPVPDQVPMLDAALRDVVARATVSLAEATWVIMESDEIEGPHQLRVQARRLRSVFKLVLPYLSAPDWQALDADMRWLASSAGPIRDRDVLATDVLGPLLARLPEDADLAQLMDLLNQSRVAEREALRSLVRSAQAQGLLLRLGLASCAQVPALSAMDTVGFAQTQLKRLLKRVRQRKALAHLSDEHRHRLRLSYKALRYATVWLSTLGIGADARRHQRKAAQLQKALGESQDAAMALPLVHHLVADCNPESRGRIKGLLEGWLLAGGR